MVRFAAIAPVFILAHAFVLAPAAAKDRPPPPDAAASPEFLLAKAREIRTSTGCHAAAPTYRVVAAMGEGQEAAQHELGECLLLVDGATPAEALLFRQEAVFWLTRAAYAGNARAQRALAVHFGTAANPDAAPAEALKWALVYEKNGDAAVYGYKALPPTFVPGLKSDLGPAGVAAAEAFAAEFRPVTLAKFIAPLTEKEKAKDVRTRLDGRPDPRRRPARAVTAP